MNPLSVASAQPFVSIFEHALAEPKSPAQARVAPASAGPLAPGGYTLSASSKNTKIRQDYLALFAARCGGLVLRHRRHREAAALMCREHDPAEVAQKTGLSKTRVALLLPRLYRKGAAAGFTLFAALDGANRGSFSPHGLVAPLAAAPHRAPALKPLRPLPPITSIPAAWASQPVHMTGQPGLALGDYPFWRNAQHGVPLKKPSGLQKYGFIALVLTHFETLSDEAAPMIIFLALLCRGSGRRVAGDVCSVEPLYADTLLHGLAERGAVPLFESLRCAAIPAWPPTLLPAHRGPSDSLPKLELHRLTLAGVFDAQAPQPTMRACRLKAEGPKNRPRLSGNVLALLRDQALSLSI